MVAIEKNCKLHEEKLATLNNRIDKLEKTINRFTGEDWKEYKQYISKELDSIKQEMQKLESNHDSHDNRITKLEIMFENTIEAINDNSATLKELNEKLAEIAKQLSSIKTESRLNDEHLEKSIAQKKALDRILDKNNRPVLLLIVVLGSALLLSLGANMGDVVELFAPF